MLSFFLFDVDSSIALFLYRTHTFALDLFSQYWKSVWLSASVGVASGGGLWICAAWTVCLVVFVLRFGPQFAFVDDESLEFVMSMIPNNQVSPKR